MRATSVGGRRVLVVDVGGTYVKCAASGGRRAVRFPSGPALTPTTMVREVLERVDGWAFDDVSIGYPGVVRRGTIVREPCNLGGGWIGFDFRRAFARPVRVLNDAAMQALGGYEGGTMLFLGLGTGLGSALIVDGALAPMELGHLPRTARRTFEDDLGEAGRRRTGTRAWRANVLDVVERLRAALLPDTILLGGGNVARLERLPPRTRRGTNAHAFVGGVRAWGASGERTP